MLKGEVRICGDRVGTRTSPSSIKMFSVSPPFFSLFQIALLTSLAFFVFFCFVFVDSDKPEPHYSRPPKVDPYAAIKQKKKYIL